MGIFNLKIALLKPDAFYSIRPNKAIYISCYKLIFICRKYN